MDTISHVRCCAAAVSLAALAFFIGARASGEYVPLFNGSDLSGWHVVGGGATFQVDNGEIVGLSDPGSQNTFLVSDAEYSDFEVELEFKVSDPDFNSGVQLRSHSNPSHNNGRLFGYQVEIDPSSRAWTGGLYFEGGSPNRPAEWLDDLSDNPVAQAAFQLGDWNHFRIVALGRRIATWINGVPAADYVDADDEAFLPSGRIGLQIHSNPSQTPLEVRWRSLLVDEHTPGDFNRDPSVDLEDYLILSANLHTDVNSLGPTDAYLRGDVNGDRFINFLDVVAFREMYDQPPTLSAPQVPEPEMAAALPTLAVLAYVAAGRHRR